MLEFACGSGIIHENTLNNLNFALEYYSWGGGNFLSKEFEYVEELCVEDDYYLYVTESVSSFFGKIVDALKGLFEKVKSFFSNIFSKNGNNEEKTKEAQKEIKDKLVKSGGNPQSKTTTDDNKDDKHGKSNSPLLLEYHPPKINGYLFDINDIRNTLRNANRANNINAGKITDVASKYYNGGLTDIAKDINSISSSELDDEIDYIKKSIETNKLPSCADIYEKSYIEWATGNKEVEVDDYQPEIKIIIRK